VLFINVRIQVNRLNFAGYGKADAKQLVLTAAFGVVAIVAWPMAVAYIVTAANSSFLERLGPGL
jgi:hypothetical protein